MVQQRSTGKYFINPLDADKLTAPIDAEIARFEEWKEYAGRSSFLSVYDIQKAIDRLKEQRDSVVCSEYVPVCQVMAANEPSEDLANRSYLQVAPEPASNRLQWIIGPTRRGSTEVTHRFVRANYHL